MPQCLCRALHRGNTDVGTGQPPDRLRFEQGHLLEINEAVVIVNDKLVPLDYRYHCQNEQNQLIFRYDNTPHFPDLPSFPNHKHLPDHVVASDKPDIEQVVGEAMEASG